MLEDVRRGVARIKKVSALPVVTGFGISTPAQAAEIAPLGDGIVVGSALIKKIEEGQKKGTLIDSISSFVKDLKNAMGSSKLHV